MVNCKTCRDRKSVVLAEKESPLGIATKIDCPDCSGLTIALDWMSGAIRIFPKRSMARHPFHKLQILGRKPR